MFRARVANPRWIASMIRHGYKGAFELAATVDYLFGYDATAGVVEDWMYEQVTAALPARAPTWPRLPDALEPVGAAGDRRAAARGRRPRAVGVAAGRDARRDAARGATSTLEGELEEAGRVTARSPAFPLSAIVGQDDAARGAAGLRGRSRDRRRARARRAGHGEDDRGARAGAAAAPVTAAAGEPFAFAPGELGPKGLVAGEPELRAATLVELPLGATADRVLGTLDLDRALAEGERAFEPGLLAPRAPGDPLRRRGQPAARPPGRRAARRGRARARRTSSATACRSCYDARFLLVGTMNPEEGELRPQLLDRFGLGGRGRARRATPPMRVEIVRRRLAFERDPAAFAARWAPREDRALRRAHRRRARAPAGGAAARPRCCC